MNTRYVLIDHENVQPKPNDLALLNGQPLRVVVFVGASQAKLSTDFAMALQARGPDGAYIKINGNGRNALDLHIAFYVGELAAKEPSASFHVISKDHDYDPLIEHLRSRGIDVRRAETLTSLLPPGSDQVEQVTAYLKDAGTARPRRRKTLANAINARLGSKLESEQIEHIVAELERRGVIKIVDGKVSYP